jgi:hypothetical protein
VQDLTTLKFSTWQLTSSSVATSLFKRACCKWHKSPDDEKTWNNFKTHFVTAQTELEAKRNAEQAGYHGVNAMLEKENLHQVETIANLANAMVADHQAFETLTDTNKCKELNMTIKTLQDQKTALEVKLASLSKDKPCECCPHKKLNPNNY